ncbi:hypothetical protein LINGRAHAP2_LOCUS21074 [Linum grandiflorum]
MASNLLSLHPAGVRPCAVSDPDQANRRRISFSTSSTKWWSPLFGWSSDPDYIRTDGGSDQSDKDLSRSEADLEAKQPRSRFPPGCFTAEKAKQLRMMTSDASSHHDAMYHSAIASRLASEFKHNSSGDR